MRSWTNTLGAALLALGCGCASTSATHQEQPPSRSWQRAEAQDPIGPGSVIRIRVVNEPELASDYRVLTDGSITYPFCGRVEVAGMRPTELEQHLRGCLADFVVDPQVSIQVQDPS